MPKTAYYLDEFTDEVMPCGTSLADWAEWLSEPDHDFGRDEPAKDGDVFSADVYEFHQVSVVQRDGKWILEPEAPPKTEWMVVRYGDGQGWDAEDICEGIEDLREWLDGSIQVDPDGAYFVACAIPKPSVKLRFFDQQLHILQ